MRPLARARLTAAISIAALCSPAVIPTATASAAAPSVTAKDGSVHHTVTLITGDRVTVTTMKDGKKAYSAVPAEGSAPGTVLMRTEIDGDAYFYPSDVIDKVGSLLDPRLFNVDGLVRDGYDDSHSEALPVIVRRTGAERPEALAADGLLPAKRDFRSVKASTAVVDKDDADEVGAALDGKDEAGTLEGVKSIWLDGKVRADALDRNLTQIGADSAWDSGRTGKGVKVAVLDTGADATHPDLAGRISAAKDFSGSGSTLDKKGHGTHVAATVAGSGAGAPGVRSGVAPEADLIIGKVLGDDGSGSDSQVIAGMEWAVAQGAKIVNMSLGSGPTNGQDPVTQALENLTTSSGTLFVVSAGNEGPNISTVSAPSIAPHALSVAAVDFSGGTASFSSRGPSFNGTVKPEIAAPGVNVVAARATGVNIGTIQNDPNYTAVSGTSMAAPHVSGAAALLAQEHPDWTPDRLKHTLMGTATAPGSGQSVYDVGAGVVDVPAALKQSAVADTGAVDFGRVDANDGTAQRTVTLTNTADTAVTLDLKGDLASSGSTPPDGLLKLSASTLQLAPGASAPVTLTVAAAGTPTGTYSGSLTATPADGGQALRIPLLLDRAQSVKVRTLDREGKPAAAQISLLNADSGASLNAEVRAEGVRDVRVPEGRYMGLAMIATTIDGRKQIAIVSADMADGADELVFDARKTRRWTASVEGSDTRPEFMAGNLTRTTDDGRYGIRHSMVAGGAYGAFARDALWISPTTAPHLGKVAFNERWRLADADSDITVGDTSTLYDVAYAQNEVSDSPGRRVTRAEVENLAKVRMTYKGMNEKIRMQEGSTPYGTGLSGLNVSSPSYLTVPRERTEYIQAVDRTWLRFTYRRQSGVEMDYTPRQFTYEAGSSTKDTWFTGPFTVGLAGQSTGARLQLRIEDNVDPSGLVGEYADFNFPQRFQGTTRLYRNGVLVADRGSLIDKTFADSSKASYALSRTFTSAGIFPMGGEASAKWTFTAGGTGEAPTAVHLLNASFDAPLDEMNRARADRPLDVRADVSGAVDGLQSVRAWVTGDGGTTWQAATTHRDDNGRYRFTAPTDLLHSGGFLGVRLTAEDGAGHTVDLALPRAIPVG
ncbi:S8 family serine peptidase [Streptomyces sp. YC504]|uniref:S8 family serine peptidase n=1 Tax=Streptomyces mesophilus TaxID=1775132 RepID=A0A6G4XBW1_9ACTN|nr:S8 family serine peptidase [Streptomyces mesophilus]NGO74131.1 S8 family serine peptidase [Streptomyces mesophilus]